MCKCWQVLTWRTSCFLISLGSIVVSFALGPLQTIFLLEDKKLSLYDFMAAEPDSAMLYGTLGGCMWLVCVASAVLLCGTCRRSVRLLNAFLCLTAVQVLVAAGMAVRFVVYCTLVDQVCLDHAPRRAGDDVGSVLGLFLVTAVYVAGWLLVAFVVCNYKLLIEYRAFVVPPSP